MLNQPDLVGTAGFEPATPTPPVWCATKLRYAPKKSGDNTGIEEASELRTQLAQEIFKLGNRLPQQLFIRGSVFLELLTR